MEDSKDTVIVTGLASDITREDFIYHFKHIGEILKSDIAKEHCEGIVTYADSETAEKAVNKLNGKKWKENKIRVEMAEEFYSDHFDDTKCAGPNEDINTAWSFWLAKNGGGGKGGKGGVGGPGVPSGNDGEDGEPGPGGKGGAGGKPAVIYNPDKRSYNGGMDNDFNNKNKWTGGGKGGKGGIGGPNVPSGYDGEDGESGPGGKGGAGGRPAITNNTDKRTHYGGMDNDVNNKNKWTGGGRGGKGGSGGPSVPSGHDGEDGEPGPGGKGGAGGRPAVNNFYQTKNPYEWHGNWNNVPWYTRCFGIGKPNKKLLPKYNFSGGGKGGKGGVGCKNVPSGHDGEDGEPGPGGKGGAGGRPAV